MRELEDQLGEYAHSLGEFKQTNGVSSLFLRPDYIAVKAPNARGFDELIDQFDPMTRDMKLDRPDGRRIATARFFAAKGLLGFGPIDWVRIVEPRPHKVGHDRVGLDHVGFYQLDIDSTRDTLDEHDIDFVVRGSGEDTWLEVGFGVGLEVDLNGSRQADIVGLEVQDNRASVVPPPVPEPQVSRARRSV